jgi:molybdopterin-containing oxidoreductase family membrane subunit
MAIMGTFAFEEDFIAAAKDLKSSGFDNISLLSPLPVEEAQEVLGLGKSPVRRFSLAGAIFGAAAGFAMAVATALVFILPTGGRAIITIPPYLIITYEMTILFGVLFTLIGFHVVSGLPAWHDRPYLASANIDRFVVVVEGIEGEQTARAEAIIRGAGAEEIKHVEEEVQ